MLCFFISSAKVLVPGEPNVAYICSRYYRAPELIFGATDYTVNIGKVVCFYLFICFPVAEQYTLVKLDYQGNRITQRMLSEFSNKFEKKTI